MSAITTIQTRGMLEAYQAVHSPELRAQLDEENKLVEQIGIDMIENAAYVLFSQGYDVDDVISYFTEATTNTIIKDYLNFSEGNLIIESVAVSGDYIEEQFELLYEKAGIIKPFIGSGINAVKNFASGAQKSAEVVKRAQNIKNIRADRLAQWKQGSLATPITPAASKTPNILQKAGDFAKTQLGKLPGAGTVAKIAKSPVGKIASKALPGLGAAAYGIDAADRAKKGDWGGAALSGLGAVTSAIPGVGLVGGLAPAAIQMGTDALGLTGDKSRKGSAKPTPAGPPSLKAKQDFAKSKGKYFSSSDQKTYKNYNDAEAAKNSRRGVKPTPTPTPAAASSSPAPSSTPAKPKVAPTKPDDSDAKLTNMQKWAKANPTLAAKVKPGQSGYDEISAKRTKPGPYEKKDQTPTTGSTSAIPDLTSVNADLKKANDPKELNKSAPANSALAKEQERRKRDAEKAGKDAQAQTVNSSYEYDAYDLVLEYLLSQGHTDTVEEANYVMMEMDAETIGSIIEERRDPRGRVSSGPMNVYRKPEGKPSQAHLDAVAAHRESEKKKSPEQKKKELDDYIQRQRENK